FKMCHCCRSLITKPGLATNVLNPPLIQDFFSAVFYRDCVLVSRTEVNHNTQVYRLQLPPGTMMQVPVGKHVYLRAHIEGEEVVRPYTPVDRTLWTPQDSAPDSDLYLMIKYLNPNSDSISVSGPEGSFSLRPLRDVTHLFLVAAGTGLTPMARLIHTALRDIDTIRKTKLLFFNRKEEDILWRSELDELAATNKRYRGTGRPRVHLGPGPRARTRAVQTF
uniref:Uncharacterized protein n=1 Tax=Periophthalmus magnuspinnatus TaxID=409849 RepID=A0A3B4AYS1_9GOBI